MEIDINQLIEHFIDISFSVQGVFHHKVEPGAVGCQQSTPFPGFIFPLSGEAQFHFNGAPYLASHGSVIHGGADMRLDKRVIGNTRWEYISVIYEVHEAKSKEICLPDMHFKLKIGESARLTELLWRLWRAFNQPGAIAAFQTETLFHCVLEEVFVGASNQTNNDAQDLFRQVSSYICNHYMDTLTVRALAEQYGVNENRLFYVFNKYAGMGAGDYLMTYRLNRAKELLSTSDASVGDIARSVGYTDPLHFSRTFSKKFGISPSQFRGEVRNNTYKNQDNSIPM